jgi:hypothetical protein
MLFCYVCFVFSDRLIVVKEGQILHFVSGDRRFVVNDKDNSEDYKFDHRWTHSQNQPLTRKISKWFFILRQVLEENQSF